MSELDQWAGGVEPVPPVSGVEPAPGSLARQPPGGAIDRHRERGLDLTPEEHRARRGNRRWLIVLSVTTIAILVLALIASGVAQSNEPNGPDIVVPAGFQSVRDGYFTYAVPKSWPNNAEYSDNTGDIVNSGPTGWAGQHVGFRTTAPGLGDPPPLPLQFFGVARATPFRLTGGHPVTVPGAAVAFAYQAVRSDGFQATVIDAYDAPAAIEIWLMVHAPADVTAQVVSSLRG